MTKASAGTEEAAMFGKTWARKQADKIRKVNWIDPSLYRKYGVKRGLRNDNGTGCWSASRR